MSAGRVDFEIEQGSTFQKSIKFYKDDELEETRDMSGYEWSMQVRKSPYSDEVLLELTSYGDKPEIDTSSQSDGLIRINIDDSVTSDLDFDVAMYDLESKYEENVKRELEGFVYLDREVNDYDYR